MCCSNGLLFYKKSLNLTKTSLNMDPIFWLSSNFRVFAWWKPWKIIKFGKNWPIFSRKILNNGYPFQPKWPLKMGRVFETQAAPPLQTKSEYPPPGLRPYRWMRKWKSSSLFVHDFHDKWQEYLGFFLLMHVLNSHNVILI